MMNYHTPALLAESMQALALQENGIYVDCTFGGGGHSKEILNRTTTAKVIAIDQDPDAIEQAEFLRQQFGSRLSLIQDNFANLLTQISLLKIKHVDGILLDLGTSSHHFDTQERGFSFQTEGKLDMRMNQEQKLSAFEVVNEFAVQDLARIFREFGEEKKSFAIAKEIEKRRKRKQIESTTELADVVKKVIYSKNVIKSQARIFQAIRIYVNDEIKVLQQALQDALKILKPQGRLAVISYHSLEDRTVKNFFKNEAKDCSCPSSFLKCICSTVSTLKIITKKPIIPTKEEIKKNVRARSAKLRIAEKKEIR